MAQSENTRNLYQRIAGLMQHLDPVEKSGQVNFGSTRYSYVRADVLFATLQKKLADAGVVVVPSIESVQASPDGGKVLLAAMRFRLVNVDDPTDFLEVPWFAQGAAGDDKAVSKCGTSGMKYFLMKLLLMSDEEDPDADPGPEQKATTRPTQQQPARAQAQQRTSHTSLTVRPDGAWPAVTRAPSVAPQTNAEAEAAALLKLQRQLHDLTKHDEEERLRLSQYLQEQGKSRISEMAMPEVVERIRIFRDRQTMPDAPPAAPAPSPATAGAGTG